MHSLSILLPNNRLLNPESRSFSVRQAASNLLSSLKHVQRVLVFHCIRTNRINGSVNQCSEIISAYSNGRHTWRDPDVTSRTICILLKYFTLRATGPLQNITGPLYMGINHTMHFANCLTDARLRKGAFVCVSSTCVQSPCNTWCNCATMCSVLPRLCWEVVYNLIF